MTARMRGSLLMVVGAALLTPASRAEPPAAGRGEARLRSFAPGVKINWSAPSVEVEAVVVLQQGQLELLACSPQTREHESIFAISARPLSIFQAMGLIGLEPGSPVSYDEQKKEWLAPRGERLTLEVRFDDQGRERTVAVEEWLFDVANNRPVEALDWVFAGSRFSKDGEFGADAEGTLVCVVDFSTALIGVGALHSSDNAALWLAANAERVPARGTKCTLVIRSRERRDVIVEVTKEGALVFGGEPITAKGVATLLRRRTTGESKPKVVLRGGAEVSRKTIGEVMEQLRAAGVAGESVELFDQQAEGAGEAAGPKTPAAKAPAPADAPGT